MGSFTNHVAKMRWVGGKSNVHNCPRKVGRLSLECPCGQNFRKMAIMLTETNL